MPSTNPFLDDISSTEGSINNSPPLNHSPPVNSSPPDYPRRTNGSQTYSTAREEKERLRDRYREEAQINDQPQTVDLPPSYDEVAGGRKVRSGYPREKEGTASSGNGHRSSGHRHRRHRDGDKEHSSRHRSAGHGPGSGSGSGSGSKDKKKGKTKGPTSKYVDTIDKMDVTGLFGGSFHHDGPFDACTPHRNKNTKAAPVLAFPADGPNNSIGGASTKKSALNEVFGREELDDDDDIYNTEVSKKTLPVIISNAGSTTTLDAIKPNTNGLTQFDAKGKSQVVHGPTTMGLGSTTFLDGAPASSNTIKEDIRHHAIQSRNGIQRKKSLSQRLQVGGNSNDKNEVTSTLKLAKTHSGHLENFDDYENQEKDTYASVRFEQNPKKESTGNKLLRRVKSLKVTRKP